MQVSEDATTAAPPQPVSAPEALPLLGGLYVGGVIAAGAFVLVYSALHVQVTQPTLFLSLIVLSCLASTLKIRLPLTRSASVSVRLSVGCTSNRFAGVIPFASEK